VHTAECKHAEKISEKNRVYFETYAEAVNAGYVPCKVCRPDQKAGGEAAPPAAPAELPFVGHMGSKRVHLRNCKWVQMAPKDKIEYFKTYQDAIDAGYSPCKTCEPDKAPTGKGAPPVSLSPGTSEAPPGAPSAAAPAAPVYIGHTGTKKVHLASCSWAEKMSERNRTQFNSYQEAVAEGYIPCKVCKPDMAAGGAAMTAEARASPEAPFVGHRGTRKVHTAECRYARAVSERNRITFATFQEAAAAGYVSCKVCKPDLVAGAAAPKAPAPQPTATATAEAAAPSPNGYVSSEAAKTFHRPDCEWAKKISPEKTVKYATKEEALAAGKSPCQVCKP
jgi:methylphosphotriester-DNA--protein-cysteine methyltransferase